MRPAPSCQRKSRQEGEEEGKIERGRQMDRLRKEERERERGKIEG